LKYSIDTTELRRLYEVDGLTGRQIAALVGIPNKTVLRYLKAAGASLRNPGYPVIELLADRDWLEREYGAGKSTPAIAAEVGCSVRIVARWLERHGIEARPAGSPRGHKRNGTEECRRKMSAAKRGAFIGSDNPNWRGGIQIKDPDRNRYQSKMWVKAVKDRDGWKCVECGATDRLHAHHIKRWCDYPDLRYDMDNGKTLCHPCHEAAHGDGFKFRWPKARRMPTSALAPEGV
jgi:hypothetical protein